MADEAVSRPRAPHNPFRPIAETANETIARQIVRRIITMRAMQPANWEADAVAEITRHLNVAGRRP
jgi:hypothetical protein